MNVFNEIRSKVIDVLEALVKEGELPKDANFDAVTAEPPRDASHGDISTNAAMVVAKRAGKNPREIAEKIKEKLGSLSEVEKIDVAGPGFINMTLAQNIWTGLVKEILENGEGFGTSDVGKGKKTNVEYVSANPTGPMHIGHARGAVVGDVLASLLSRAGYNVTKEYYINDAGGQVEVLAESAYLRYLEALGQDIGEIPEGLYPGEYLKAVGEYIAGENGDAFKDDKESNLPKIKEIALEQMMTIIKKDLADLGVVHDVFSSEAALIEKDMVEKTIKSLEENGLVYQGVLEPPKGKKPDDWEEREQTLFKATEFGDDVDRPLKKSDGSGTYFSSDIAYHFDKMKRGFNDMVLVLGADHGGYVKRMKAAVSAMSGGKANIDILLYQLVNFMEDGKPLKMSKRAGTYITVSDVVEAVGKDVVRFIMLTRKADAILDFDLKKVVEQSKDNPVFYVQYAHARASSVIRNAVEEIGGIDFNSISKDILEKLTHQSEIDLIKKIAEFPRIIEAAAKALEPHRIAFYLQELAASFHSLWNAGKDDDSLRFIIEGDEELTKARLALVKACALTIASGLDVMGVEPVMEM